MSNVAQNFRDSCRSGSPSPVSQYRSYDRPDNLSTRQGSSNYLLHSLLSRIQTIFLVLKVFRASHLSPSVLAQLAAEFTFIPPSQLAPLKIAIYRNKIQYKELDTKQRCNKTRTMTHRPIHRLHSIKGYKVSSY